MLAEALSALFTGHYDLVFVPVALPEPLVRAMLPSEWGNADDAFLSQDELSTVGVTLPDAGQGKRWVCIEAGKQIDTGVNYIPMGKSTFFEAKVEIPFLRHPQVKPSTHIPFSFKTVVLFSSRLMSFSSNHMTGLRSHHAICIRTDSSYEAMDWLEVKHEGEAAIVPESSRWTEDLARKVLEGWWVGENTGHAASKFIATTVEPAKPRSQLRVRLNIPALTSLTPERIKELAGGLVEVEENGWVTVDAAGFDLSESTKMQVAQLSSL
ncbi:hypothetical protein JCM10908_001746 [Rhodotorula pacifica]|uniref:uncharacterized protein n=1 Tax=Rhodotorula pacifica TaxID=1495444 RepID=UPI0031711828